MEQYQWNTKRHYDEHGQRIVARVEDGCILFSDLSRHIDGLILTASGFNQFDKHAIETLVMTNYDFGNYSGSMKTLKWEQS
jgi:hypothetical protein